MGGRWQLGASALMAVALLGGCSSEPSYRSNLGLTSAMASHAEIAATDAQRKTLSSRVLGGMALERVTGRKPDPAHFTPRR